MALLQFIGIFFFGTLFGCVFCIGLVLFLLGKVGDGSKVGDNMKDDLGEADPSEEESIHLSNVLQKFLRREDTVESSDPHPSEEKAPISAHEMDKCFIELSLDAKEQQKHVRSLHLFFGEFNKVSRNYSKDLSKLAQLAESYVKAENNKYLDKWWNALSIAVAHLSQDQELLSDVVENDIFHNLHQVYEEHSLLERQLHSEGNKHLQRIKEAMTTCEMRTRERDKMREKANAAADRAHHSGNAPSLVNDVNRYQNKLGVCERLLQDAFSRLASSQQDFNEKMPRIIADLRLMTSNSTSTMRELLTKLADYVTSTHAKSQQVMHRLKMDLAASSLHYDPVVKDTLEAIAQGCCHQLDMSLESSAALAASLPSRLPSMPPQFGKAVGQETCVWLNAFSGRMYRDAARSAYFHKWFREKVETMLNKDTKPGYVDRFVVGDVKFGSIPPLLCNMQWTPAKAGDGSDTEHDISCTADMTFRSGLKFAVSTRLWLNWPRDKFAFIPVVINLEITELLGRIRFGVRKQKSFLSFVDEPFSRFTVHSELGSQFKVRNFAKLTNAVIKKIKSHIRKKLIYPKAYFFRLVWPKTWWPDTPAHDAEGEKANMVSLPSETTTGTTSQPLARESEDLTGAYEETGELHETAAETSNRLRLASSTVRESLSRWFQRGKGQSEDARKSPRHRGKAAEHEDEYYEERWKMLYEARMRQACSGGQEHDSIPDNLRSCVSTSELARKTRYPHIHDIFAPLAVRKQRTHSLSDFRSASLEDLLVDLYHAGHNTALGQSTPPPSPATRVMDDTDYEMQSRLGWLGRLRRGRAGIDGQRMTDGLLLLKASVSRRRNSSSVLNNREPGADSGGDRLGTPELLRVSSDPSVVSLRTPSDKGPEGDGDSKKQSGGRGFFRLGKRLLEAKESIKNGLSKTVGSSSRRKKVLLSCFEDSEGEESESTMDEESESRVKESASEHGGYSEETAEETASLSRSQHSWTPSSTSSRLAVAKGTVALVAGALSRVRQAHEVSSPPSARGDPEHEAMNLAWQARAQAMSLAAEDGEQPSMQGFLRTPSKTSVKMWVVLKYGGLAIFSSPADCQKGVPKAVHSLIDCVCRPSSEQFNRFELGVTDSRGNAKWLSFWAESDVQCKAWVMAVQHSANLRPNSNHVNT